MARTYRAGEVAKLTGVTVRTLHHYDRIGLLPPSARSDAGYRLYAEPDLLRLQHVLTLRAFGFGLDRIAELLAPGPTGSALDLAAALLAQRRAVRRRVRDLQGIDAALGDLLATYRTTGAWDWPMAAQTAAAIAARLHEGEIEMASYYTEEQQEQFRQLRDEVAAEEIAAVEEGWRTLLAEVRASRDLDPASPAARALAERWDALTEQTMRPFRTKDGLPEAIAANYERGAFEGDDRAPQAEDFAFIARVKAARDQA